MHGCALKIPANTCKINIKVLLLVQKHMTRCFLWLRLNSCSAKRADRKKCGCRSTTFPQPRMMTIRLFLFRKKKKKLCLLLEFSFGGTRNLPGGKSIASLHPRIGFFLTIRKVRRVLSLRFSFHSKEVTAVTRVKRVFCVIVYWAFRPKYT